MLPMHSAADRITADRGRDACGTQPETQGCEPEAGADGRKKKAGNKGGNLQWEPEFRLISKHMVAGGLCSCKR